MSATITDTQEKINFFIPGLIQRRFASGETLTCCKAMTQYSYMTALYFVMEFVCMFCNVFLFGMVGYQFALERSAQEVPAAMGPTGAATTAAAAAAIHSSYFTNNIAFVFAVAIGFSSLNLLFMLAAPGITADPMRAVEQFMYEICGEAKRMKGNRCCCLTPGFMFFAKLLICLAGMAVGGAGGVMTLRAVVDTTIFEKHFLAHLRDLNTSTSGYTRAIMLSMFFSLIFTVTFNLFHRRLPQGHKAVLSDGLGSTGGACVVALARFLSIFCIYGITGSVLNFATIFSYEGYNHACYFLAGETAGIIAGSLITLGIDYMPRLVADSTTAEMYQVANADEEEEEKKHLKSVK